MYITFYYVSSLSERMVFLAHGRWLLHVKNVRNKGCEYKYKIIVILPISATTLKAWFDFDQIMWRRRTKCVFTVCKVTGMFAAWYYPQSASHFSVAAAHQENGEFSFGPSKRDSMLSGYIWPWQSAHQTVVVGLQRFSLNKYFVRSAKPRGLIGIKFGDIMLHSVEGARRNAHRGWYNDRWVHSRAIGILIYPHPTPSPESLSTGNWLYMKSKLLCVL